MARLLFLLAGLTLSACAPEIGDECETSADCSITGDRLCDLSQPGGYCTVQSCDPGSCPDEARCVEWRGQPTRTAETWCMVRCEEDDDCRTDNGYVCVRADELEDAQGQPIAEVIDEGASEGRFCVAQIGS